LERERRRERIKTHVSMRERVVSKVVKNGCTNIISHGEGKSCRYSSWLFMNEHFYMDHLR